MVGNLQDVTAEVHPALQNFRLATSLYISGKKETHLPKSQPQDQGGIITRQNSSSREG